ncbi:hypothetical protein BN1723_006832 [Verticillium longisporum]|uniref:Uncharacterized protein n=1 Tax=Verticillium longisporum TaxID=100787 RepID=A0A0G4NHW2_VERLO|nr:hypothetical protein BN1723_006832 [Verticillium longisporum]
MSFFAGDSRPSEAPPPPHGGLKTTEIGVIVGAVTAVVLFIAIIFRPKPIRMKLASYLPSTITKRLFKAHLEADTEMTSRPH